jgi:hypothetical protein
MPFFPLGKETLCITLMDDAEHASATTTTSSSEPPVVVHVDFALPTREQDVRRWYHSIVVARSFFFT